jgi:ATP-dependent protease ClpP protease subunit
MTVAKIFIKTDIGEPDFFAQAFGCEAMSFSASDMSKFLEENADATEIEVEISSNGGSVTQGFEIYDLLKNCGKKVTTRAYKANSIATVIFLAGSTREITKNAQFTIHNPFINPMNLGFDGLEADDLQAIADDIRACEDKIFNLYKEVIGFDAAVEAEVRDLMKADTDLTADNALKYGFATSIINGENTAAQNITFGAYTDKIAAYITKNKTTNKMDINKILAKFDAIEASIKKVFKAQNLGDNGEPLDPKNSSATAADGTILYFSESALAVGIAVFSDEAMTIAMADGVYAVDSSEVTVMGGLVSQIESMDAKVVAALTAENADLKAQLATALENTNAVVKELKDLSTEVIALKSIIPSDFKNLSVEIDRNKLSPAQLQNLRRKEMMNVGKAK